MRSLTAGRGFVLNCLGFLSLVVGLACPMLSPLNALAAGPSSIRIVGNGGGWGEMQALRAFDRLPYWVELVAKRDPSYLLSRLDKLFANDSGIFDWQLRFFTDVSNPSVQVRCFPDEQVMEMASAWLYSEAGKPLPFNSILHKVLVAWLQCGSDLNPEELAAYETWTERLFSAWKLRDEFVSLGLGQAKESLGFLHAIRIESPVTEIPDSVSLLWESDDKADNKSENQKGESLTKDLTAEFKQTILCKGSVRLLEVRLNSVDNEEPIVFGSATWLCAEDEVNYLWSGNWVWHLPNSVLELRQDPKRKPIWSRLQKNLACEVLIQETSGMTSLVSK